MPEHSVFQLEVTMDEESVFRHFDFLGLQRGLLVAVHIDELPDGLHWQSSVTPTSRVTNVELGASSSPDSGDAAAHIPGLTGEVTVALEIEGRAGVDLDRAQCDDPECQFDHGYTGAVKNSGLFMTFGSGMEASTPTEAISFVSALTSEMARS